MREHIGEHRRRIGQRPIADPKGKKMLILASASPRRRELLERNGVQVCVEPADIDEHHADGELPQDYVHRMAVSKCRHIARKHRGEHVHVLGADTIVVLGREILGKPTDEAMAMAMLRSLSGREHEVMTAVCLINALDGAEESFVCKTIVQFDEISDQRLSRYVASGEPMDKAGAYGIQGGAEGFVKRIDGSYTNVVGLPLCETLGVLEKWGDFLK